MIKLKNVNNELLKKTLAGTTAFVLTFSGVPRVVHAASSDYCTKNSSVSSNACYDRELGEFEINGEKYTLRKQASDNSIIAESKGKDIESRVVIKTDGSVDVTTSKKTILGFKTSSNEKFKVKKFTGDSIEIDKSTINDKDIKKSISTIEKYINSTNYTSLNYIKLAQDNPTKENLDKASLQLSASFNQFKSDLKNNKIKYSENKQIDVLKASSPAILAVPMIATSSTATAGELAAALGSLSIPGVGVAVFCGLVIGNIAFNDGKNLSPNDLENVLNSDIALTDAVTFSINDVEDITKWDALVNSLDTVKKRSEDNNPNNDYYRTIIDRDSNVVFINILEPLSLNKAASILSKYDIGNEQEKIFDPYQIYTYKPQDAAKVIDKAGGVPGIGKPNLEYQELAENHAFKHGFNNFNKNTFEISKFNYRLNDIPKVGVYFWHYHFHNKLTNKGERNAKHVFFGMPVIITQKDINKLSGKTFNLNELEMYNSFWKNAEKLAKDITKYAGTIGLAEEQIKVYQKTYQKKDN